MEEPEDAPRWPWGFGFAALLLALVFTGVIGVIVATVAGVKPGTSPPALTIVSTVILDGSLLGVALGFAAMVAPPRPWHFGLERTKLGPALGWAALGTLSFYLFAAVYSALVHTHVKQQTTESLGADRGTLGLIVAGCVVMILAPIGEELFFRGFFYRSLRSKFPVLVAALINGVTFGLLHFQGVDSLVYLPQLMVLGFIFCLVTEKTGSLWPAIGMHALNNAVAYAVQAKGGWEVSLVVGPLMILAAATAPRIFPSGRRPAAVQ